MPKRDFNPKNPILERYKKEFAVKKGFKSWNQYRQTKRLQDLFKDLHDIATKAIEDLTPLNKS